MGSSAVRVGLLSWAILGLVGCRSDLLREPVVGREGAVDARVEILEGSDCPGLASVASAPEHCAWPSSFTNRSLVESAVVQVVAHIGTDGHAESVHVVDGPLGFDGAATDCAMRLAYRPRVDENRDPVAADTCRVSLRLARYVSDINPTDPAPFPCPPVRSPTYPAQDRDGRCVP